MTINFVSQSSFALVCCYSDGPGGTPRRLFLSPRQDGRDYGALLYFCHIVST